MILFLLNILLAVLWCLTWGSFSYFTLIGGFVVSYFLLGFYSRVTVVRGYETKVRDILRFSLYFTWILCIANIQIAYEILTPTLRVTPRIVRFDVTNLTPIQRSVFVSIINLTPGTLVIDIAPDRRTLYIFCMYAKDYDLTISQLTELKDRMVKEVFR